jgi:hypothetical protein
MVQTRACGRALRAAFAFMAPIIDAGLETTPAEEMELIAHSSAAPVAQRQDDLKAKLAASVAVVNAAAAKASPPRQAAPPRVSAGPTNLPNYGKAKGAPIYGANLKDLEFYAQGCRKSLADSSKEKWHAKEQALLEAIQDEMARQQGPGSEEPPPHTDADAQGEAF